MHVKPRIAHLSGPTATIQNTPPLVTSNKARALRGLEPRYAADGHPLKYDALRPQRLAAKAKLYVEQFSAHPLEADAAELYGQPDGFMGADGTFRKERRSPEDKPVYEIEVGPEDGLYPLPYMAVQSSGAPWEDEGSEPGAPLERVRQGFFPDGHRSFEEIDRLSIGTDGTAGQLSALADIDFFRGAPSGGYTKGLPEARRTDQGRGDIPPEIRGRDFFAYKPYYAPSQPARPTLARLTNEMQAIASSGAYDGIIWTQGSPQVEETAYWYSLLIDTRLPISGNAAQRAQGQVSNDGPKNIIDSARYITSRIWADEQGNNRCGVVVIQEQQIFAAREVAKVDARPGGYVATGGHGGILGQISHLDRLAITYVPAYKHTYRSEVNLTKLPASVSAVRKVDGRIVSIDIPVKDETGRLIDGAIPSVSIVKDGGYATLEYGDDPSLESDLIALIEHKLALGKLTGLICEGLVPYGYSSSSTRHKLLLKAAFSGIPVVRVGRNAPEGFADPHEIHIGGANLTATKARILLMACLLKLGSLPAAANPDAPTPDERATTRTKVAAYQALFDSH